MTTTPAAWTFKPPVTDDTPAWRRALVACAMIALAGGLLLRAVGPSDMWDQRQPRTVSYTVDIIEHGGSHWLLPIERGATPATKPPLYNWLAVPCVALLGYSSDLAHKLPSAISAAVLWLLVVRLGRRLDPVAGGGVGWLAGAMLATSYFWVKLAYLARPDMLLTLLMVVAWAAATAVLADDSGDAGRGRRRGMAAAFWIATALGTLAKGPPALVGPVYALVAARWIRGRWRDSNGLGWWWGIPLVAGVFGLWITAVGLIDRQHLVQTLWFDEFFGRITGLGSEGNVGGPVEFLTRLFHMPYYFFSRSFPWSILSVVGLVVLWGRTPPDDPGYPRRGWRALPRPLGPWLHAAGLYIVVTLVVFSLSTGKRADYIAAACPPATLIGAWWWLRGPARPGPRLRWAAPAVVILCLALLAIDDQLKPRDGDGMNRFIDDVREAVAREPMPVLYWCTGDTHMQYYLGDAGIYDPDEVVRAVRGGRRFWLLAGRRTRPPNDVAGWLAAEGLDPAMAEVARFETALRATGWPELIVLYRVGG